ncbi:MAG: radical SAM protein [Chitinophagales bacterium]
MAENTNSSFRICLINPPVIGILEPWYDTPDFGRVGLAYLAGYLRKHTEFSIQIIDAKLERLSFEDVLQRLIHFNPNVIGYTAYTNEIKPAAYMAALAKRHLPHVVNVIGGVHVTALPKETLLEFNSFDIGVVGEGEMTFYELCSAIYSGDSYSRIKGVVYREDTELKQNPPRQRIADQDSIPFPAWDLLPAAETYYVQSERGCPFSCIFCMNPNGKVARKRSVQNMMDELNWIIKEFKPKRISFGDELFSVDMPRTRQLLDAMIENRIGEEVAWDVQTHVHFVDAAMFEQFKKANVERVELGIETGDEESLRKMGKGTNLEKIMAACDAAKAEGVKIGTFFLLGQPNESMKSIAATVNLAIKLNPDLPMFGLMTPYPGTEVAKMAAKGEGGYKLLTTNWDEYNKQIGGAMEFANLTRRQIEWIQIKAYVKVYLYNNRFLDFAKFVWQYRIGAWEVLKKVILRRSSLQDHLDRKPSDYEQMIAGTYSVAINTLIEARDNWNTYQHQESKRLKLEGQDIK